MSKSQVWKYLIVNYGGLIAVIVLFVLYELNIILWFEIVDNLFIAMGVLMIMQTFNSNFIRKLSDKLKEGKSNE